MNKVYVGLMILCHHVYPESKVYLLKIRVVSVMVVPVMEEIDIMYGVMGLSGNE